MLHPADDGQTAIQDHMHKSASSLVHLCKTPIQWLEVRLCILKQSFCRHCPGEKMVVITGNITNKSMGFARIYLKRRCPTRKITQFNVVHLSLVGDKLHRPNA